MSRKRQHIGTKAFNQPPKEVLKTVSEQTKKEEVGQNHQEQVKKTSTPLKTVNDDKCNQPQTTPEQAKKEEVKVEVPKVEISPTAKVKRNLTLSVKNDYDLEILADKVGLPKSKIVDILLSKFLKIEINDEFDIYDIVINKG
jgi:hypothetical protein